MRKKEKRDKLVKLNAEQLLFLAIVRIGRRKKLITKTEAKGLDKEAKKVGKNNETFWKLYSGNSPKGIKDGGAKQTRKRNLQTRERASR